eukprot:6304784-Amphidinium_carterae.1
MGHRQRCHLRFRSDDQNKGAKAKHRRNRIETLQTVSGGVVRLWARVLGRESINDKRCCCSASALLAGGSIHFAARAQAELFTESLRSLRWKYVPSFFRVFALSLVTKKERAIAKRLRDNGGSGRMGVPKLSTMSRSHPVET